MKAEFLTVGDSAVSIQLGSEISLEINRLVRMLYKDIETNPIDGVVEMVPTYASLMVHYRAETIEYKKLISIIEERINDMNQDVEEKHIVKEIPICYGKDLGPDLELCASIEGISEDEIIRKHSEHIYYAYMLGFAPGHAYMSRFEEPFSFKRRESPRIKIAAGSIVAMESLSNFIPFEQPCGWNILGGTPLKVCDYKREDPFIVHAGEYVKFTPVSIKDYERIRELDLNDRYIINTFEKAVD
ncbi:MAG: 5-oxoprolinase subunit B family protein [Suipraeoptans sp.]